MRARKDDNRKKEMGSGWKTSRESQNAAQRTSHQLSRCLNVLTKRPFLSIFGHKLIFVIIHVLSEFQFLSFVTIWVIEFCHNMSQFKFWHNFGFVTIWVLSQLEFFKFFHNLSFWVFSQFEFFSFVSIWVFEFYHHLSFWVWSKFGFLSFITIWVFVLITIWVLSFHHNLRFLISSKFLFLSLS